MQDIREYRRDADGNMRELRDVLVGMESQQLKDRFEARRKDLEQRLESGETESAKIIEARRIGRNDPCPCGSNVKFKKCCGSRLPESDERIKE